MYTKRLMDIIFVFAPVENRLENCKEFFKVKTGDTPTSLCDRGHYRAPTQTMHYLEVQAT